MVARSLVGFALGALLAGGAAPAFGKTAGEALADTVPVNPQIFTAGDDPWPAHPASFPGGVTGLPDVAYQILPGYRPTRLDLYLPPKSFKGPRPVIVFTHGGGWAGGGNRLSGAFANFPGVLAAMAARGYVVAAVSYRFSGEVRSPGQIRDVKAAIRWLRGHADKYGIDKSRFGIFGGSAGGHLAALAATSCGAAELEPPLPPAARNPNVERQAAGATPSTPESDCVQAAVSWYGVFDFHPLSQRPEVRAMLGCSDTACTEEQIRMASPQAYVSAKSPPMLLIVGTADTTVPPNQTLEFHKAAEAAGAKTELVVMPGIEHSFIGRTPAETQAASREGLARTIDFFDRTIGDAAKQ